MSTTERTPLSEEICALFTRLTQGNAEADLQWAREMAQEMESHDHWLQTRKLDQDARLFLYAATAFSMRCLKDSPYKCAVLTRNLAEAFAQQRA